MKIAVLGNGDSRSLFTAADRYDYLIGCNIPWRQVDATVVMDVNVLEKFLSPVRFYCSRNAWRQLHKNERYIGQLIELFDSIPEYDSAGHAAARIAIKLGATEIDIYGCDSWFTNNTESYTHQFVDSRSIDMSKNVSVWRARWYEMFAKHPQIKFNFIGEPK